TQQVLARYARLAAGLLVVVPKLPLEQLVVAAGALLLTQLLAVLGLPYAAAAVLARRVRPALDGALVGHAALPLEEQLHALPAPPADSHATTLPSRSVSVTMVLLNEVLMCACPNGMFLRTRRRARVPLRPALACGI